MSTAPAPNLDAETGLVDDGTDVEIGTSQGLTILAPLMSDRMLFSAVCAGIAWLVARKSPHRTWWVAGAALFGAFVVPKFLVAYRAPEGTESWAISNPFGPTGTEPVLFLTD